MSSVSFLGPEYAYYKQIKNPSELGMNAKGSNIATNFTGLIDYVQVLVSGTSKASKTGKPLGNRFFLPTLGKCKAKDTGNIVERFLYFDNIPQGRIPILSDVLGTNMKSFRGLIPGVISNLNNFNPASVADSLSAGINPECQNVTLQVVDENNNITNETHYVATVDLAYLDPCSFPGRVNLVTKKKCSEGFNASQSSQEDIKLQNLFSINKIFALLISIFIFFLFFFSFYELILQFKKVFKTKK
jgi:hypothetical protein